MMTTPEELGVVGALLIFMWKVLGVVQQAYLSRKVKSGDPDDHGIPTMSPLACQVDPTHFQRIKEIHEYTEGVQKDIASGAFSCAWQDRDEVRDLREELRELTKSMRVLNTTIKNGG